MRAGLTAVLFDLDGTLIDSAPDLASATNDLLAGIGLPPLPYERLRPHAGSGARGMLREALKLAPSDPSYAEVRDRFYVHYEQRMLQTTQLFEQVDVLLDALDSHGVPWGIVTNKAMRFAEPGTRALGLWQRAQVVIAGDSTPHTKPHPAPLLAAAERMGHAAGSCVYVGDDARDVQAGTAAGMLTLAAAWGYLGQDSAPSSWGAARVLDRPHELLHWLALA